jgi:hypothetical protein
VVNSQEDGAHTLWRPATGGIGAPHQSWGGRW